MKSEQVENPRLEKSPTDCLNFAIEELEPIIAPGIQGHLCGRSPIQEKV